MKVQERLISYVTVRTPSNEESERVPSSMCQFDLMTSVIFMENYRRRKERKISRRLDLLHIWIPYLISAIMKSIR